MSGAPRSAPTSPDGPRAGAERCGGSGLAPAGLAALLLLCAAPHLLRMALPVTTVADSFYPHAAWMLREGLTPYVQFTQVAFPLAEAVLAAAFALFGHDLRVVEICNLAVVLAVAVVLNAAARRMVHRAAEEAASRRGAAHADAASADAASAGAATAAGIGASAGVSATDVAARRAGVVAALAWSWCAWVVHFNLFERETWVALGTALALRALFAPRRRRAWAVGGGLALAFCIKITALLPALAVFGHLLLRGRPREAARSALAWLALVGAATLLCWWAWGTPFLQQVFLFGYFRNPNVAGPLDALGRVAGFTDPVLALMFAALLAWGLPRLLRPAGAPALVLLAELAFLAFVSPTVWNHHLIGVALAGALLLGGVAADWSAALALRMALALALVVLAVLALPATYMPDMTASPRALAPYTEGWSREGIARSAEFVRRYSGPGDVVCTLQPAISLQAGRVEFVRSIDLQSLALAIEAGVAREGLAATWALRQGPLLPGPAPAREPDAAAPPAGATGFGPWMAPDDPRLLRFGPYLGRLIACGLAYDRPLLLDGLRLREIALVVEPLPPLLIGPEDLRAANYYRFEDHALGLAGWRPVDGVGRRVVRELFTR